MIPIKEFTKAPGAVLDYQFDWSAWLADSETITQQTVIAGSGLTVDSSSISNGVVTAWLSGGAVGKDYAVTCQITTSQGRTDARSILIKVRER